jgi:uncharacterized protein (TIGR02996 family)
MPTPAEESAFLRPIADHFRDDGPRLIYADYLSESPDPADQARGEFIRLQLATARMPADHPHRAALTEREEGLRACHYGEWTKHLKGLAAGFQFRRGLVDSVTVDVATFAEKGEELFRRAPIRRVRFSDAGRLVDRLVNVPLLSAVRELVLCDGGLGNGGLHVLLRSPYLDRVESLDLSFNGLCDGGMWVLAHSPALPALRSLHLNDNRLISTEGVKHLGGSPYLRGVRVLDVSANDIGDGGMTALTEPGVMPHLHTLRLRANHIGDAGCEALARSPLMARLLAHDPRLDLRQNAIGSAGLKVLAASPHLAAAVELDLSHNYIDDDGLIALAQSPHAKRLTTLLLQQNRVSTRGARALARSPLMARLTHLDVSHNPHLTKSGIEELWKRRHDFHTVIE